jgi:hypothetical protein
MSELTKERWHYQEESDAYTHIVRGPSNEHIVQLSQDTSGKAEGRARLMAAAPELLEALRKAEAFIEDELSVRKTSYLPEGSPYIDEAQTVLNLVAAAIAKSEATR